MKPAENGFPHAGGSRRPTHSWKDGSHTKKTAKRQNPLKMKYLCFYNVSTHFWFGALNQLSIVTYLDYYPLAVVFFAAASTATERFQSFSCDTTGAEGTLDTSGEIWQLLGDAPRVQLGQLGYGWDVLAKTRRIKPIPKFSVRCAMLNSAIMFLLTAFDWLRCSVYENKWWACSST